MSFEAELKSHLAADATLFALVNTRIHPDVLPQETVLPAIVYSVTFDSPQTDLDGADGALSNIRLTLDVWARNDADRRSVRDAVRSRLKTAASGIQFVPINAGQSAYEPETRLYRYIMEFSCWWRIN